MRSSVADHSAIEWTDATWNPTVGCSVLTPGCTNCYAMKMAARLEAMGQPIYAGMTKPSKAGAVWTGKVELSNWGQVIKPLSWKKPRRIFVNSMSDLFHESLPDEAIDKVFAVMALCPQHTFQVLTKRAERMARYLAPIARSGSNVYYRVVAQMRAMRTEFRFTWPLPNVWLGVSAERQQEADERIPHLLSTPAAVRFVSAEPLLGPISFRWAKWDDWLDGSGQQRETVDHLDGARRLDWVIVGGESGPNARPMHPKWARDLRDECTEAGVAFFYKQTGEWLSILDRDRDDPDWRSASWVMKDQDTRNYRICNLAGGQGFHGDRVHLMKRVGKKLAGRLLDGKEHNEFPNPRPSSPEGQPKLSLREGERAVAVSKEVL
jgi:protein gp37